MDIKGLRDRYEHLLSEISQVTQKKTPAEVLVAVSKGQPFEKIKALADLGHRDFGENYVQELLLKEKQAQAMGLKVRWHMIGQVQSNKMHQVGQVAAWLHTVVSAKSLPKLAAGVRGRSSGVLKVLIQVALESSEREGCRKEELLNLAQAIRQYPELDLQGLMGLPLPGEPSRPYFKEVQALEESLRPLTKGVLSLGMSHDYKEALTCGASFIRVGTLLFGARKPRV